MKAGNLRSGGVHPRLKWLGTEWRLQISVVRGFSLVPGSRGCTTLKGRTMKTRRPLSLRAAGFIPALGGWGQNGVCK